MKEEQVRNRSKAFLLSGVAAMIGLMAFTTAPRCLRNAMCDGWPLKLRGCSQKRMFHEISNHIDPVS
jgi:hypothetical protein